MICGALRAPQIEDYRIRVYFGWRHRVKGADVFERITREGLPAEIQEGYSFESELAYGNHCYLAKYGAEVLTKVAADIAFARSIVFPVTREK